MRADDVATGRATADYLPADCQAGYRPIALTAEQKRAVDARDAVIKLTGPPASGKTTALAACALACRRRGGEPLIVCSHAPGKTAFNAALDQLRNEGDDQQPFHVATFAEHAARWLSSSYLAAGAAPQITVGGRGAARYILERASKGLLDMSWPMFARAGINLDLPHLSRPEAFLDEAASLFLLLQRARVSPEEFEEGCAAGLAAFYGEGTERAVVLLQDPLVRQRASGRGRDACRVSVDVLAMQRKAERDLAAILAQLYRDYRGEAATAGVRPAEDIVESTVRWLSSDERAARSISSSIDVLIIDDAEDAEPGLVAVLQILRRHRTFNLVLAGSEQSRIDGFEGRRSALSSFDDAARIELAPLQAPAPKIVVRFASEAEEADWLASQISDLLAQGARPGSIALLSRTTQAAALYARHLRDRGVPAACPSSMLQRQDELADLLALCAVVDDPADQEHLLRVLASPLVGLSDASLWALCRDPAERMQLSLEVGAPQLATPAHPRAGTLARNVLNGESDDALPATTRALLGTLRERLASWRAGCFRLSPVERIAYLAEAAGFRDRWHAAPPYESERLRADLARVTGAVALAAALCGLDDFGKIASLIEDEVVALEPSPRLASAVVTDSIVSAKGLGFDHVFVAGVAHERFPRIYTSHAMAFSRSYGLIVRENVAGGAAQTAKFAWYYTKFGAKAMYLEEEQRALAYGLSRARRSASASGFGTPPHWAREHDLLAAVQ